MERKGKGGKEKESQREREIKNRGKEAERDKEGRWAGGSKGGAGGAADTDIVPEARKSRTGGNRRVRRQGPSREREGAGRSQK